MSSPSALICSNCGKKISGSYFTVGGNKTIHQGCFTCQVCRKQLDSSQFYEKNGKYYCKPDYLSNFAPKCARCSSPIDGRFITVNGGKQFHESCFICDMCHSSLVSSPHFERSGKFYCKPDFLSRFAPKCARCLNPIDGNYLTALDRSWHKDCFTCAQCGELLGSEFYRSKKTTTSSSSSSSSSPRLLCKKHYLEETCPRCDSCLNLILEKILTADGKKFHPTCFVCNICKRQLEGGYHKKNEKYYCEADYLNVFAPKCKVCGKPCIDKCSKNWWGEFLCSNHPTTDNLTCFDCGRFISPPANKLSESRRVCDSCYDSGVTDVQTAEQLFSSVAFWIAQNLNLQIPFSTASSSSSSISPQSSYFINSHVTSNRNGASVDGGKGIRFDKENNDRLKIELCDSRENLRQIGRQMSVPTHIESEATGITECVEHRTGPISQRSIRRVAILKNLSSCHFSSVVAHEAMHVYLWMNNVSPLPSKIEEGFCELVSFLFCMNQSADEFRFRADCIRSNKDDKYGRGVREALAAYRFFGGSMAKLIDYVRKNRKFPDIPSAPLFSPTDSRMKRLLTGERGGKNDDEDGDWVYEKTESDPRRGGGGGSGGAAGGKAPETLLSSSPTKKPTTAASSRGENGRGNSTSAAAAAMDQRRSLAKTTTTKPNGDTLSVRVPSSSVRYPPLTPPSSKSSPAQQQQQQQRLQPSPSPSLSSPPTRNPSAFPSPPAGATRTTTPNMYRTQHINTQQQQQQYSPQQQLPIAPGMQAPRAAVDNALLSSFATSSPLKRIPAQQQQQQQQQQPQFSMRSPYNNNSSSVSRSPMTMYSNGGQPYSSNFQYRYY